MKYGVKKIIRIPVPRDREIREGTAKAIINQAKKIKGQDDEI